MTRSAMAGSKLASGRVEVLSVLPAPSPPLVRRARVLAWAGIAWHGVEFAVALAAGLAAGSIALVAFGIDSLVEAAAGFALVWRLRSEERERRAQQLIAVSFFLLAAYVAVEAVRTVVAGDHPEIGRA